MKKVLSTLLATLLLGSILLWLHWKGGLVTFLWQDYQLETTVGIFLLIILVLFLFLRIMLKILNLIFNWRKFHIARQRKKIPAAIMETFIALERGLPKQALNKAKFIQHYSPVLGLAEYLESMALIALNEDEQAKTIFKIMTTYKGSEYLGWQGLARLSLKNERQAQALAYAEKALQYMPKSPWALKTIYEQAQTLGDFSKADNALSQLKELGFIEGYQLREKKGALLTSWAKSLYGQHSESEAFARAKKAYSIHPGLEEGKILAELYVKLNHFWRARFLIKRLWKKYPDETLAHLYLQAVNPESPLKAYEAAQSLTANNKEHEASLAILAETAYKAQLWGAAEEYLHQLEKIAKDRNKVLVLEQRLTERGAYGR